MSRTKKGSKGLGWDYWGKRPLGYGASGKSKNKRKMKQEGIQRERRILERLVKKELANLDNDNDD